MISREITRGEEVEVVLLNTQRRIVAQGVAMSDDIVIRLSLDSGTMFIATDIHRDVMHGIDRYTIPYRTSCLHGAYYIEIL